MITKSRLVILAVASALAVVLIAYLFFPIGCEIPQLNVKISMKGSSIVFDLSNDNFYLLRGFVRENRYNLFNFEIWSIDREKKHQSLCWKIKALPGANLHPLAIIYGKIPPGYEQTQRATVLKNDEWYQVNESTSFIVRNGEIITAPR